MELKRVLDKALEIAGNSLQGSPYKFMLLYSYSIEQEVKLLNGYMDEKYKTDWGRFGAEEKSFARMTEIIIPSFIEQYNSLFPYMTCVRVGDGMTFFIDGGRHACTVTDVSDGGLKVVARTDFERRNPSYSQQTFVMPPYYCDHERKYIYEPDPKGRIVTAEWCRCLESYLSDGHVVFGGRDTLLKGAE